MKATFTQYVIGHVNPASGEIDTFVDLTASDYTPMLRCAKVFGSIAEAETSINATGTTATEKVLPVITTMEVRT